MRDSMNSTPARKGAWKALFLMCYMPNKKLFHRLIVVAIFTAAAEASLTLITKAVVDDIVALGAQINLFKYGALYALLVSIIVICIRTFIRLAGRLSMNLMYALRKQSFEHMQELSFSFFDNNAVGWLLARITSDTARIARVIAWGTRDLLLRRSHRPRWMAAQQLSGR